MAQLAVPSAQVQIRALAKMNNYFSDSKRLTKPRRSALTTLYESLTTFEEPRQEGWPTSFRINKGHTSVTKIHSRLFANRFEFLVSGKVLKGDDGKAQKVPQEAVDAIQDTLTFLFEKEEFWKRIKRWGKKAVSLGQAWAMPKYQMNIGFRKRDKLNQVASSEDARIRRIGLDEKAAAEAEVLKKSGKEAELTPDVEEITEKEFETGEVDEFPTIDVWSFTDVYIDPRYLFADDLPAVMHNIDKVRWASIVQNKSRYFNLDRIEAERSEAIDWSNTEKIAIYNIKELQGPQDIKIDLQAINLKRYYGVFSLDGSPQNEAIYQMTALGNGDKSAVLIELRQIKEIPAVLMECFEDIEVLAAVGLYEPIRGLESELNFQKNSQAQYLNVSLNRSWLWSALSGVKPSHLISRPNNIIVCKGGVQKAKQNLEELPMRSIPSGAFPSQSDIEKQIEQAAFQLNTSTPREDKTVTTATGQRIGFFDNSSVVNYMRQNIEAAVVELAYQLIEVLFDNMGDSWVIERIGSDRYFKLKRALFDNPRGKYNIRIEAGSSSFDSIQNRRADAIAALEVAKTYEGLGEGQNKLSFNFRELGTDLMKTFEKRDINKYLVAPDLQSLLPGGEPAPSGGGRALGKGGTERAIKAASPESAAITQTKEITGQRL